MTPAEALNIDIPKARNGDPLTSHAAAATVTDTSRLQATILALYSLLGDLTDSELIHHHNLLSVAGDTPSATDQNIRSRRSELVSKGLVRATDRIAFTIHGRKSTVWDLVR